MLLNDSEVSPVSGYLQTWFGLTTFLLTFAMLVMSLLLSSVAHLKTPSSLASFASHHWSGLNYVQTGPFFLGV